MADDRNGELRRRSPRQVVEDHLRLRAAGDLEGDLERNISPEIVLLTKTGVYRGHAGVRQQACALRSYTHHESFRYESVQILGELGYLEWSSGTPDGLSVNDGADSYLVRGGWIVGQTIPLSGSRRRGARRTGRRCERRPATLLSARTSRPCLAGVTRRRRCGCVTRGGRNYGPRGRSWVILKTGGAASTSAHGRRRASRRLEGRQSEPRDPQLPLERALGRGVLDADAASRDYLNASLGREKPIRIEVVSPDRCAARLPRPPWLALGQQPGRVWVPSNAGTGRALASAALSAFPFSSISRISHSISAISRRWVMMISSASKQTR